MNINIEFILFNLNFIKNLKKDFNFEVSKIKLFLVSPSLKKQTLYFSTIKDLEEFYFKNQSNCPKGQETKILSLSIKNNNFQFFNEFEVKNETEIFIQEKVQFDKNEFYLKEIKRFKRLLFFLFLDYNKRWSEFKEKSNKRYVESCYVDKYYDFPENDFNFNLYGDIIYPDIIVDAGSDLYFKYNNQNEYKITGLQFTEFFHEKMGKQKIIWSSNSKNLLILNKNEKEPVIKEINVNKNITKSYLLFVTVSYPFGLSVTKNKLIYLSP